MKRVATGTDVITILAGGLGQVLIASDAGSLESASGQLFLLVGHQVAYERELIHRGLLGTTIEDSDLGIWDTTAEARLNVRLVLLEAAATSRS